ncbi:MAG TPA: GNAT family N-acetyltransferase [Blastococcus sp.]|nr:GNAT family N-acetyltransferase [Blastococcus sp.]
MAAAMTGTRFTALVITSGGNDVGVVPWLARRRGPLTTVNAVPFPYAGPLVPAELLEDTLAVLRRRARGRGVVRQQFGLAPHSEPAAPVAVRGFDALPAETYLLDLSVGADALWNGLTSEARRSLRKAERDGIRIVEASPGSRTLERAVRSAYMGRGTTDGYHFDTLTAPDQLESTGLAARWTVALSDGTEIGSSLSVANDDIAHGWLGALLPEHRKSRANVALYWDAICWAQQRGVRTLDMIGIPDAGIRRFKSQFGGTVHTYTRLQRTTPLGRAIGRVVR